jgi:hypothetical protein
MALESHSEGLNHGVHIDKDVSAPSKEEVACIERVLSASMSEVAAVYEPICATGTLVTSSASAGFPR